MRTRLKLKPGQRGTKKLVSQYGDQLVCVRYRYDIDRKKRFKTIELIIDEVDWEPRPEQAPTREEPRGARHEDRLEYALLEQ